MTESLFKSVHWDKAGCRHDLYSLYHEDSCCMQAPVTGEKKNSGTKRLLIQILMNHNHCYTVTC